jgi:hypothetical protein
MGWGMIRSRQTRRKESGDSGGEEAAGEDDVEQLTNAQASTFVSYVYESMKRKKETNLYSRQCCPQAYQAVQ